MERIPILRLRNLLLITLQVDLHDQRALALQEDVAAVLSRTDTRGVLIDVSALDMVDSFLGRVLNDISAIGRLMGAETVVVGLQPAVAVTLVEMGLGFNGVRTALTVDRGFELLTRGDRDDARGPSHADAG